MIAQGLENRPELASLRLQTQAAQKFVEAERDLKRPSVTLTAVGGALPYINPGNANPGIDKTYEAAAVNVQIPIFNGFLFSARRRAAEYQLQAEEQRTRDLQDRVARDVRTAYEQAKTKFRGNCGYTTIAHAGPFSHESCTREISFGLGVYCWS